MQVTKPKTVTKDTLAIFWRFTKQHKLLFWYATLGSTAATIIADILPPLVIAGAFNRLQQLYSHHQTITFKPLAGYFYAYIAVSAGSLVLWRTQAYSAWRYMI